MIYAIWAKDTPYVKFGWVKKREWLASRREILQVGCPFELEVIASIDGSIQEEQAIHQMLSGSHHRGEWFQIDQDVSRIVAMMQDGTKVSEWELNKGASRQMRRVLWWQQHDSKLPEFRIRTKSGYTWTQRKVTWTKAGKCPPP
jgi:hypothetical protein